MYTNNYFLGFMHAYFGESVRSQAIAISFVESPDYHGRLDASAILFRLSLSVWREETKRDAKQISNSTKPWFIMRNKKGPSAHYKYGEHGLVILIDISP